MKKINITLIFALVLAGCVGPATNPSFQKLLGKSKYNVVMFVAPDCPLCMSLVPSFNNLIDSFPEVQFLTVHSGENYDAMELNMYATKTQLKSKVFRDADYTIAHQFKATITPEFVLCDSTGKVFYQGLMDDRIVELGNMKTQWSKHYLRDAIKNLEQEKPISIKRTNAVGCVLEY